MRRIRLASAAMLLLVVLGCATGDKLVISGKGVVRMMTSEELMSPVKPKIVCPVNDFHALSAVSSDDMVGQWYYSRAETTQLLDRRQNTSETKDHEVGVVAEYCADGIYREKGQKFGNWMLADGVLSCYYDAKHGGNVVRSVVKRLDRDTLTLRWADSERYVKNFGLSHANMFSRIENRGGYESDGCFRRVADYYSKDNRGIAYTETVVESPSLLRRMGSKSTAKCQDEAKADVVEAAKKTVAARRKELEDLKKAGIITEAEFAAEVKKLEGAGK